MVSLSIIARPVFHRGIALLRDCPASAEELGRELSRSLAEFDERSRREGHSPTAVEESRYALCAWLDEIIFSSTDFSIGWLEHSLVVAHFRDPSAGTNFFERLDGLHRRADLVGALELYTRCILLGFRGRYRLEDPSRLDGLVADALAKTPDAANREPPLFSALRHPPGKRSKERTGRILVWIGLASLAGAAAVYALLAWLSRNT
jgi:type VI secretion system protein ImpK